VTDEVVGTSEPPVPDQLGPYEILEPLRGLDAWERYLATSGAELVQITVVHPEPGKSALAARELARAMRQVANITGEHVVRTFRAEKEGDATLLVTQHLAGRWLREILAGVGRLDRGLAMRILLDASSGLAAVHDASAPHGDVRPASVLVGDDGIARVGWLGLGSVAAFLRLPEPVRAARLPYRAPEEQRGRMASAAGDLYSLGVLVVELLTGAQPPPASPSGVTATATVDGLRNAGLPDALARFVIRLLSPTPSARPTSARAVHEVLEEASAEIPAASREEVAALVRTAKSIHPQTRRDVLAQIDEPAPRPGVETIELPPAEVPRLPPVAPPPVPQDSVRRKMTTPPPRTRPIAIAGPPPIPGPGRRPAPPLPPPKQLKPTLEMHAVKAPPAAGATATPAAAAVPLAAPVAAPAPIPAPAAIPAPVPIADESVDISVDESAITTVTPSPIPHSSQPASFSSGLSSGISGLPSPSPSPTPTPSPTASPRARLRARARPRARPRPRARLRARPRPRPRARAPGPRPTVRRPLRPRGLRLPPLGIVGRSRCGPSSS